MSCKLPHSQKMQSGQHTMAMRVFTQPFGIRHWQTCSNCFMSYNYRYYKRLLNQDNLTCDECKTLFMSEAALKRHQTDHRRTYLPANKRMACETCGKMVKGGHMKVRGLLRIHAGVAISADGLGLTKNIVVSSYLMRKWKMIYNTAWYPPNVKSVYSPKMMQKCLPPSRPIC